MIRIAIDGPSGAGKSTIAKMLASRLGIIYFDTGALYRAVGYCAMCKGINLDDKKTLTEMAETASVEIRREGGEQRICLDGEDITARIRNQDVSKAASAVSSIPEIRQKLLEIQKNAAKSDVVMDGRDIGTVIMPDADIKIFLTASPEDRARRRYLELLERGETAEYDAVLREVIERDERDANRAVSPLKPAVDAVTVDTTGNTLEETVRLIAELVDGLIQ